MPLGELKLEADLLLLQILLSKRLHLTMKKGVPVVLYGNAFLHAINFLLESVAKQRLIEKQLFFFLIIFFLQVFFFFFNVEHL